MLSHDEAVELICDCFTQLHGELALSNQQKTKLEEKLSEASENINHLTEKNNKLSLEVSVVYSKLDEAEEDCQQLSNDFNLLKEDHEALGALEVSLVMSTVTCSPLFHHRNSRILSSKPSATRF